MAWRLFVLLGLIGCSIPNQEHDDDDDQAASSSASAGAGGGTDGTWTPPIGIPEPSFGIHESADGCADCVRREQSHLDGLDGLAAGTIVELSGGPFDGGELLITGSGTADRPIFVRGKNPDARTIVRRPTVIAGSYLIVENIDFDFSGTTNNVVLAGDHLALRHSDAHGVRSAGNGTVVYVHESSDIVLYANHVWDNGDFSIPGELDIHGIGASASWRIWVVDNHLHQNRGDSIQFGHAAANSLGDFYIGRNDIHDDGENCIDIKEASNVVISENKLHGSAPGFANVVLHDCPVNAAVIYNEIYDELAGVSMASLDDVCAPHQPIDLWVVRNTFHDIGENGVQGWGAGKRYYVSGNTFTSVAIPIAIDGGEAGSIVSESEEGLPRAFDAFMSTYGLDISQP